MSESLRSVEVRAPVAPQIGPDDVKPNQWICLEDSCTGGFGQFVKYLEQYTQNARTYAVFQEEDSWDRWGGKLKGEIVEEEFPLRGWVQ